VDIEVTDLKDQLNECRFQIKKLQCQLVKSKEELTQALIKADEEGAGKAESQKALSELKFQLAEVSKVLNYYSDIKFSNSVQCYKNDLSLVQPIFTEYSTIFTTCFFLSLITIFIHGTESFMGRQWSLGCSRSSLSFMGPEIITGPCPEAVEFN
jgi:hypothetical protein